MNKQQRDTYGDNRSPTRAAFQKTPRTPVRYGSTIDGAFILTYADVQMKKRSVTRNYLKSKSADIATDRAFDSIRSRGVVRRAARRSMIEARRGPSLGHQKRCDEVKLF